jgi:hypothetical protein
MPKPRNMITVTISDSDEVNMANYSKAFAREMTSPNAEPGVKIFDESIGTRFSNEQRSLMKENGLDEFDLVFINGKSIREIYGHRNGKDSFAAQAMKAVVIGALADGDKRIEFCNVEKGSDDKLKITPPTAVEADIKFYEPKPKLNFIDKLRAFFGMSKREHIKTKADFAKEVLNESNESRQTRHSKMESNAKSRMNEVRYLQTVQKPFTTALEEFDNLSKHNANLFDVDENGRKMTFDEIDKRESLIGFDSRPNIRHGMTALYMLHKGMPIDEIVSTSPEYDEKKLALGKEYNKMVKEAAEVFGKVHKKTQIEHEKIQERFNKDYDEKHKEEYEKFISDARDKAEKDNESGDDAVKKAQEEWGNKKRSELDKPLRKAEEEARQRIVKEAAETEQGRKVKDTLMGMGEQLCLLEPCNKNPDAKNAHKDFAKLETMREMTHHFRPYMKNFTGILTDKEKEKFAHFKDVEAVAGNYATQYAYITKYIGSDTFIKPEIVGMHHVLAYKVGVETLPGMSQLASENKTFSDMTNSIKNSNDNGVQGWLDKYNMTHAEVSMGVCHNPFNKETITNLNKDIAMVVSPPEPADEIANPPEIVVIELDESQNEKSLDKPRVKT